jgi:endonuclease/exonuclease/phosphatase family metal-dependent hydrolase
MNMLLTTLLLLITCSVGTAAPADSTLQIMSFNIRYNNPDDGVHAWPHRKERVAGLIRFHGADVVGMQEVLKGQIDDLEALLPGYAWIGVGRDDGAAAGEFSPVFYRADRIDLLDHGTFWLSETPGAPGSVGWDAAITRVATWARFRDASTGQAFFFLNTHFDHVGQQAREHSARLILQQLDVLAGDLPVIVTGDFNAAPDNPVYATMTGKLADARRQAEAPAYGPEGTFFGFTVEEGETGPRIDYVFVQPRVRVRRFGTLSDQWSGHYPSDHLPVLAEVVLP